MWACSAVDVLMVYILYSELTQKIDTLTHLLNRRSYESRPASLRGHAVIYYFDVDEFKSVNDTFGHGVGDAVLAEVGSTIYAVFSKVGYCYRIGGDEFCVLLKDRAQEAPCAEEFLRRLEQRREALPFLPRVSFGSAAFSGEDVVTVKDRADREMYRCKSRRKASADVNVHGQRF